MVRAILSGGAFGLLVSVLMVVVVSQQTERRTLTPLVQGGGPVAIPETPNLEPETPNAEPVQVVIEPIAEPETIAPPTPTAETVAPEPNIDAPKTVIVELEPPVESAAPETASVAPEQSAAVIEDAPAMPELATVAPAPAPAPEPRPEAPDVVSTPPALPVIAPELELARPQTPVIAKVEVPEGPGPSAPPPPAQAATAPDTSGPTPIVNMAAPMPLAVPRAGVAPVAPAAEPNFRGFQNVAALIEMLLPGGVPVISAPPEPLPNIAPVISTAQPGAPQSPNTPAAAPDAPASAAAPRTAPAPAAPVGPGPVVPERNGAADFGAAGTVGDAPQRPPATQLGTPNAATPGAPGAVDEDVALLAPDPVTTPAVQPEPGKLETPPTTSEAASAPGLESPVDVSQAPDVPQQGAATNPVPTPATEPPAAIEKVVITDRLPRIGDVAPTEDGGADDATAPEETPAPDALTRNGVAFDNPDGRPILAVVLWDDEGAVVNLPIPFSVVIEARSADAVARIAAYRSAGQEVLLVPDLPDGALPTDVSVSLQDAFSRLPDAVAVMDTREGLLQSDRDVLGQVVSELAETGHGFLTFPRGLNTALQVAQRGGVTAGLVFREIDAEGQDLRAVKRFLDQAAFRARQENAVILVGRNRPETIAALAEWALGNRAASIALAPVSAALKVLSN